jgi:hypothetical protein
MQTQIDGDFIWGAKEIGAVLGRNTRVTFHLLETGAIECARRVRGRWVVSRRALLKEFGAEVQP